jgi:hypothetical protein
MEDNAAPETWSGDTNEKPPVPMGTGWKKLPPDRLEPLDVVEDLQLFPDE